MANSGYPILSIRSLIFKGMNVIFFFQLTNAVCSICGRTHVLIYRPILEVLFMIERGAAVWCGEDDLVRSYSFMTRSSPWMTAEGMKLKRAEETRN